MQEKKISPKTSSADIIGGNDDLLLEILILLPVNSLFRFRLVSKRWRSLIDTESFHLLHCDNRRRRRPPHQFILRSAASQYFFVCDLTARTVRPLRFRFEFPHVKILQSSHGLLLLECRIYPCGDGRLCVYNPATEERRVLLHIVGHDSSTRSRFCLIFDPSESYDYTVFRLITHTANHSLIQMEVYDSRTQRWEYKEKFSESLQRFPQLDGCNDRLYFITCRSSSLFFCPNGTVASTVANPPMICPSSSQQKKFVVESNQHLHHLVLSLNKNENLVHVYEMTDEKCWVLRNRVGSDRPLLATFGGEQIEVLGFVRGEREDDSILVCHMPGKIMVHRFSDGVSEEIVDFSKETYCLKGVLQFGLNDSHHYIESLASVK